MESDSSDPDWLTQVDNENNHPDLTSQTDMSSIMMEGLNIPSDEELDEDLTASPVGSGSPVVSGSPEDQQPPALPETAAVDEEERELVEQEGDYSFPENRYAVRLTVAFNAAISRSRLRSVTIATLTPGELNKLRGDLSTKPVNIFGIRLSYAEDIAHFQFSLREDNFEVVRKLCNPNDKSVICLAFTNGNYRLCKAHHKKTRTLQAEAIWYEITKLLKIKKTSDLTDDRVLELKELIRRAEGQNISISPTHVMCLMNDGKLATRNIETETSQPVPICSNFQDGCFNHAWETGLDQCTACDFDVSFMDFVVKELPPKNSHPSETAKPQIYFVSRFTKRNESKRDPVSFINNLCRSRKPTISNWKTCVTYSYDDGRKNFISLASLRIYCQMERFLRPKEDIKVNFGGWLHGDRREIYECVVQYAKQFGITIKVEDAVDDDIREPKYFTFSQDGEYIEENLNSTIYEFQLEDWCYVGERPRRTGDKRSHKFAECHVNNETDTTAAGKMLRKLRDDGTLKPKDFLPCRVLAHFNHDPALTRVAVENIFIISRIFLSSGQFGRGFREVGNLQLLADGDLPVDWLNDVNVILMKECDKKIVCYGALDRPMLK